MSSLQMQWRYVIVLSIKYEQYVVLLDLATKRQIFNIPWGNVHLRTGIRYGVGLSTMQK